jgi:hypothetical protein
VSPVAKKRSSALSAVFFIGMSVGFWAAPQAASAGSAPHAVLVTQLDHIATLPGARDITYVDAPAMCAKGGAGQGTQRKQAYLAPHATSSSTLAHYEALLARAHWIADKASSSSSSSSESSGSDSADATASSDPLWYKFIDGDRYTARLHMLPGPNGGDESVELTVAQSDAPSCVSSTQNYFLPLFGAMVLGGIATIAGVVIHRRRA